MEGAQNPRTEMLFESRPVSHASRTVSSPYESSSGQGQLGVSPVLSQHRASVGMVLGTVIFPEGRPFLVVGLGLGVVGKGGGGSSGVRCVCLGVEKEC